MSELPLNALPLMRWRLSYSADFTHEQAAKLKVGFIPRVMDEKWLISFERDRLDFHRSWTGFCIFRLHLEETSTGSRVS